VGFGFFSVQAFAARDRDGTGYVSVEDVCAVLRTLGCDLSPPELRGVLADLRVFVDGMHKLDYKKFVEAVRGKAPPGL
jgi:Ca2+-binding EF-hand superfamily protein